MNIKEIKEALADFEDELYKHLDNSHASGMIAFAFKNLRTRLLTESNARSDAGAAQE